MTEVKEAAGVTSDRLTEFLQGPWRCARRGRRRRYPSTKLASPVPPPRCGTAAGHTCRCARRQAEGTRVNAAKRTVSRHRADLCDPKAQPRLNAPRPWLPVCNDPTHEHHVRVGGRRVVGVAERRTMAGALLPARGTPKTPYPPPPTKEAVWTQQDQTASVTLPETGRICGFGGNPHYGQRNGRRTREHKYELGTDSPQVIGPSGLTPSSDSVGAASFTSASHFDR